MQVSEVFRFPKHITAITTAATDTITEKIIVAETATTDAELAAILKIIMVIVATTARIAAADCGGVETQKKFLIPHSTFLIIKGGG